MTNKTYPKLPLPTGEPPKTVLPEGSPLPKPPDDPEEPFVRKMYGSNMSYDNRPMSAIVKSVSEKTKINPSLLLSSAMQEGMNQAITHPDEVSEAYVNSKDIDHNAFPVDGFYNYGLDRFGDNYQRLKKYLPEGFEQRFKPFKAINEKKEPITTAAFDTNESALIAKSAMLKDAQVQIEEYAKKKGITIPEEDKDYFVLSAYNGGIGNGKSILDEYAKAKDKRKFIDEGQTTKKQVHSNISPRLKRMKLIQRILSETNAPN